jgi:hypothetical protein
VATPTQPTPGITIDVLKDLDSLSDFKKLISANSNVLMQLASEFAKTPGETIAQAAGTFAVSLDLTASPSWTVGPVSFSLKPEAKLNITVANQGEAFAVALALDSTATTNVQLAAAPAMTYINIDIDFDITGSASGAGNVAGIGISGKASGGATATLSFCQPMPSSTIALDALKMAFNQLVFPTAPDSIVRMANGSSCRMNFNATLNCEVDATYGLGNYKVAAPSAALVEQSLEKVWQKLTLPTATVNAGATASVKYAHSSQFGIVVTKQDAGTAFLYLVRSGSDEWDESAGIKVGITTTAVSVALDPTQLSQTIQNVTGSAQLASTVVTAVSTPINNLETQATAKLNKWISDVNGTVGVNIGASQQKARTSLFNFKIDLTQASLAEKSWTALLTGDVAQAMNIGGFSLLPGSGLSDNLKKSSTIQFQFFNLFSWTGQQDFFNNSSAQLGADGTIKIISDIGIESSVQTKQALNKMSFHFTATATEDTKSNISNAQINLHIEISEKGDPKGAAILGQLLTTIGAATLQPTIAAMQTYAQAHATGTLGLIAILKPSAYGKLSYSPYQGNKPPTDQTADRANWNAIHDATVKLMNLSFVAPWTYDNWGTFNSYANTGSAGATPDRHNSGNPSAVPSTFWGSFQSQAPFVQYFFLASAGGMNLFEDLVTLSKDLSNATTIDQWNAILKQLVSIIQGDANIDYAKPLAAAVLAQAAQQGSQLTASTAEAPDASTFTATLELS